MKFSIAFSKVADIDLREAAEWYEERRKGLGMELLEEVRGKIEHIREQPLIFQVCFEQCRSCSLKRFPYKIIYSVEETIIRVWAIIITSAILRNGEEKNSCSYSRGLLIALVFTLFVIPAMYSFLSRSKKQEAESATIEHVEETVEA